MATEREVKYQVLDQALFRRLGAMDHIGDFALEHTGTVDIVTVYLDTPDLRLYYGHCALRLRIMADRVFLSYKGPAASSDSLILERPEEETDAPAFSEHHLPTAIQVMELMPSVRDLIGGTELSAALRCSDRRTLHYVLHQDERSYEIACDTVIFTSPRRPGCRADAMELEIEQMAGSLEGLENLMRAFETFFAVVPRHSSSKYRDGLSALGLI